MQQRIRVKTRSCISIEQPHLVLIKMNHKMIRQNNRIKLIMYLKLVSILTKIKCLSLKDTKHFLENLLFSTNKWGYKL